MRCRTAACGIISGCSRCDFLFLLFTIVAPFAERLKRASPELGYITTVRLNMVTDQLRRVTFQPAAYLACELIAHQDRPAQLLPARGLMQLPRFSIR